MKVCILAAPLGQMNGREACACAINAWRSERPGDEVAAYHVSGEDEGARGESGLADVIGGMARAGRGAWPQRGTQYVWASEAAILLDYTAVLEGATSSALVGEDLNRAARAGAGEVICALPMHTRSCDGGLGMLAALAGEHIEESALPSGLPGAGALDAQAIVGLCAAARAALRSMRITVLVPGEQRLTGFHGLARSQMYEGLDGRSAQELDGAYGALAEALCAESTSPAGRLIGAIPDWRGAYAGVAGGLAFALECLGARAYPIGDVTVRARCAKELAQAELVVYIAGRIGAHLPSGLMAAIAGAGEAPVVLIYDYGGIARGEVAKLGLAGAYELRPERAFSGSELQGAAGHDMGDILAAKVLAVARTWGY